jgi:hypothetical protein
MKTPGITKGKSVRVASGLRGRIGGWRDAFITVEVTIAISLAGLMAGLAAMAVSDYRKALSADQTSRAVRWAAEAQLQRVQAGAALDSRPPAGMIRGDVVLRTTAVAGEGQWAGFQRVTVTAEADARGRTVRAQTTGYVLTEERP